MALLLLLAVLLVLELNVWPQTLGNRLKTASAR